MSEFQSKCLGSIEPGYWVGGRYHLLSGLRKGLPYFIIRPMMEYCTSVVLVSFSFSLADRSGGDWRVDQSVSGFTNTSSSTFNMNLGGEWWAWVSHFRRNVVFNVRFWYVSLKDSINTSFCCQASSKVVSWRYIYVLTIITKQFTSTSRSEVVPRTKTSLTPGRDLSWPPHVLRMVSLARLLPGAEKTATSRKSSSCLGWGSSSNVLSSGLTSILMSLVISLHSGKLRGLNCSSQAQQSNMSWILRHSEFTLTVSWQV